MHKNSPEYIGNRPHPKMLINLGVDKTLIIPSSLMDDKIMSFERGLFFTVLLLPLNDEIYSGKNIYWLHNRIVSYI